MTKERKDIRLVLVLLYPVMFDEDLLQGVDRVMQRVVEARALDASPEEYLIAVQKTLESHESLSERFSKFLPKQHSEGMIRDFLNEIERRLQDRI